MWVCNRNLYRTKDGKMVEEGDHRAHVLLFSRGDHLASEPVVLKLEKTSHLTPRPPSRHGNGEQKAQKPVEDKAIKPEEDKGAE